MRQQGAHRKWLSSPLEAASVQHTDAIKVQTGGGSSIVVPLEALTSMGVVLKGEDLAANSTTALILVGTVGLPAHFPALHHSHWTPQPALLVLQAKLLVCLYCTTNLQLIDNMVPIVLVRVPTAKALSTVEVPENPKTIFFVLMLMIQTAGMVVFFEVMMKSTHSVRLPSFKEGQLCFNPFHHLKNDHAFWQRDLFGFYTRSGTSSCGLQARRSVQSSCV